MSSPNANTLAANVPPKAAGKLCSSGVPIATIVKRIDRISTLPNVAVRVMEIANDPDAGAADLKRALEADPALSARVLKCLNSSAYALRSEITNLHQAVSFLGFSQVRNLAVTASVSQLFKNGQAIGTYNRIGLWRHLVAVAICARLIGMRQKLMNFEDAFLAGLMHDIGIILEDQHVHGHFSTMVRSLTPDKTLMEAEREHLGFDHTVLGGRVAKAWKFPPAVQAAIRFHHASEKYRGDDLAIVQCVEVANLICTLKDITSVGIKLVRLPSAALAGLCLEKEDVKVLATDIDHELSLHDDLFIA